MCGRVQPNSKRLTRKSNKARRIAVNIAKLPELMLSCSVADDLSLERTPYEHAKSVAMMRFDANTEKCAVSTVKDRTRVEQPLALRELKKQFF